MKFEKIFKIYLLINIIFLFPMFLFYFGKINIKWASVYGYCVAIYCQYWQIIHFILAVIFLIFKVHLILKISKGKIIVTTLSFVITIILILISIFFNVLATMNYIGMMGI